MRTLILAIHSGHPNDVESAKITRRSFGELGYELIEVSLASADASAVLGRLLAERANEIFFFLSDNYYASSIRGPQGQLLHQLTGIPLVIHMHDHPLYFMQRQERALDGTIVFAPDAHAGEFIRRHYGVDCEAITNIGSLPHFEDGERAPSFEDFSGRRNELLCPMNLCVDRVNIDGWWAQIKALPAARREAATRTAEAILTDCVTPLHVAAEPMLARLPESERAAAITDQLLVLNFVKLWRRERMVRALAELPILISSEYVPAELEFRYPKKVTMLSMRDTIPLYRRYRFVVNSNPLLHALHDRVTSALFCNAVALTDRNETLTRLFSDEREVLYFDYDGSSIVNKIAPYLDDARRAFALTQAAYDLRARSSFYIDSYRDLVAAVARRWTGASVEIPA